VHPIHPQRVLLVCFSFLILSGSGLLAQSAQAENDNNQVPLRMLVDYGQGKEKRRQSHRGIMEPVGLPMGQVVLITLEFPKKHAGLPVMIRPMDGGEISAHEPMVLSAEGTIAFNFRTGSATGLYRLMVRAAEQYEIHLYAFDPNAPLNPRRGSDAR
jgi:hypothetical protein